jgi:hypothetical protein
MLRVKLYAEPEVRTLLAQLVDTNHLRSLGSIFCDGKEHEKL